MARFRCDRRRAVDRVDNLAERAVERVGKRERVARFPEVFLADPVTVNEVDRIRVSAVVFGERPIERRRMNGVHSDHVDPELAHRAEPAVVLFPSYRGFSREVAGFRHAEVHTADGDRLERTVVDGHLEPVADHAEPPVGTGDVGPAPTVLEEPAAGRPHRGTGADRREERASVHEWIGLRRDITLSTVVVSSPGFVLDADGVRDDVRPHVEDGRHHEDDGEHGEGEHRRRPAGRDEEDGDECTDDEV